MSFLGLQKAIDKRKKHKRKKREAETRALWEKWDAENEHERQRQHELEMLKASQPTNVDRVITGLKWVVGSAAAILILPPALAGAGAGATVAAITAGATAIARLNK